VTKRYHNSLEFSSLKRRKVEVNFEGGDITSDGGVILLREMDKRIGLTDAINKAIPDPRRQGACQHSQKTLLKQRIYGLALGYEDLNDHTVLRRDGAIQAAAGEIRSLASASTLCRLENRATQAAAFDLHKVLVNQFIASFKTPPKQLILDFDATHDLVHGNQEGRHFNKFYDGYCFLPLYVFCGTQLLTSYLRPASRGGAHHTPAVLKLLVKALRQAWPKVRVIIRADAGFCSARLLNWCDRNRVDYLIGMGKNSALTRHASHLIDLAETLYQIDKKPQKLFDEFDYQAGSWKQPRRMIVKAEHNACGENTRYVVTSLKGTAKRLYQKIYCARGNMENCIKEQKSLFSDRTSCHHWWPNQFRVLLSGLAYVLMDAFRRVGLASTELCRAQMDTIRNRLLKVGGVVIRNTRRIVIQLCSHFSARNVFEKAHENLLSG
jgi:hypothetical protein